MAWDTSWYVSLAHSLSFESTFFPGYPFMIRLLAELVRNYWLAAFMIAFALGLASLPVFQAIAEAYMDRAEALGSTIIMSFFPYIFLFTTVAYSEALFLLAVLSSWYLHLKNKSVPAVFCSVLAALTKTYGVLIILPMFLDSVTKRRWREALLTSVPVLVVVIIILPYTHKDLLTLLTLELNTATWAVSRETLGNFWFRDYIVPVFTSSRPMSFFHFFHAYALAFIALAGYLAINSVKVDWRLGIYSIAMFAVVLMFGYTNGLVRYTSFIFPIWLSFKTKNVVALALAAILFYVHSLVLWNQFLWAPYPM